MTLRDQHAPIKSTVVRLHTEQIPSTTILQGDILLDTRKFLSIGGGFKGDNLKYYDENTTPEEFVVR